MEVFVGFQSEAWGITYGNECISIESAMLTLLQFEVQGIAIFSNTSSAHQLLQLLNSTRVLRGLPSCSFLVCVYDHV